MKTDEIILEFSGPQMIENMHDPFFSNHVISFHSDKHLHFSTIQPVSTRGNGFNAPMTWLGYFVVVFYIAYFENKVSNILRHSQLHLQHHLDCLWSWTNLHSFCCRYFQTRLYIIFTQKVKSLRKKDHIIGPSARTTAAAGGG